MRKSDLEKSLNRIAEHKVREHLLLASLGPFMFVSAMTTFSFYCTNKLNGDNLLTIVCGTAVMHVALVLYWIFVIKRLLLDAKEFLISKGLMYFGATMAYAAGGFLGWIVEKHF